MAKLEQEVQHIADQALERQEKDLSELRARTGMLMTAASLIASFLGGQALARGEINPCTVLGLGAFGASVGLCIYVLLPKRDLTFALDGPGTYGALYEVRYDEEEVSRRLTYWLDSFRQANELIVVRLTKALEIAGLSLLTEIGLLSLGLAVG